MMIIIHVLMETYNAAKVLAKILYLILMQYFFSVQLPPGSKLVVVHTLTPDGRRTYKTGLQLTRSTDTLEFTDLQLVRLFST